MGDKKNENDVLALQRQPFINGNTPIRYLKERPLPHSPKASFILFDPCS